MKIKLFILLIIAGTNSRLILAQNYESKWQETEIKIDGEKIDWKTRPNYFNGETGILYETRNDAKNLYLLLEIPNQEIQMKIMHAGISAYFKVNSKPKIKALIQFPTVAAGQNIMQPGKESDIENIKQNYLLNNKAALTEGFLLNPGYIYSQQQTTSSITFANDWDEKNALISEIQIPYSYLFAEGSTLDDMSKITINIELKVKGIEPPKMHESTDMMESHGGAMGQPPSGMNPPKGMNPPENSSEMGKMFNDQSIRFKIILSSKSH